MTPLEFTVRGLRTTTGLNVRECWQAHMHRVRRERGSVLGHLILNAKHIRNGGKALLPLRITLTRLGPRCCDSDNLQGGLKAVRDEIAEWLGLNDGNKEIRWQYEQARSEWGVRVRIERERTGGDDQDMRLRR